VTIKDIEIDYDRRQQRPVYVNVTLTNDKAKEIIRYFFNKMEYKEKQDWINKNATIL
jgi:hypothetical protein